MPEPIEGAIVGKGLKFGIVVSRFNDFITSRGCWQAPWTHSNNVM